MQEEGFIAHLYAGEADGYSLSRAFKEVGGDNNLLLEIDLKREVVERDGKTHDIIRTMMAPIHPSFEQHSMALSRHFSWVQIAGPDQSSGISLFQFQEVDHGQLGHGKNHGAKPPTPKKRKRRCGRSMCSYGEVS